MTLKDFIGVLACIGCAAQTVALATAPDGNFLWWGATLYWAFWGGVFLQPFLRRFAE
jgi:hypothetical protein